MKLQIGQSEDKSGSKLESQGHPHKIHHSWKKKTFWKYLINQLYARVCVCLRAPLMLPSGPQTTHITHSSLTPPQVLGYKHTHSHTRASSLPLSWWFSPFAWWSGWENSLSSTLIVSEPMRHSSMTTHPWMIHWSFQMNQQISTHTHTRATIPLLSGDRTLKHNSLFAR